ncbi:MAG: type II secretion system F family protein [Desulfitobacteriaceae bacterium]|nr:type II secretion system F family protein [Desulfitobacteriaceae bacterium]
MIGLLTALTSLGMSAVVASALWLVLKKANTYRKKTEAKERAPAAALFVRKGLKKQSSLPPQVQKWIGDIEERIKHTDIRLTVGKYIFMVVMGVITGLAIGIGVFKNIPAAVILAVGGYLLPERILASREAARQQKILDQLGGAVRIFAGEFAETPQLRKALSETARKVPDPLGKILQEADRELLSGKSIDDVTANIASLIKNEYGRVFAQLLREAENSAAVRSLFSRLAVRIASQQDLVRKNRSQLAGVRILGIMLNALLVPTYLAVNYFIPETNQFLVNNTVGRMIVVFCCASFVAGIILDKAMSRVAG